MAAAGCGKSVTKFRPSFRVYPALLASATLNGPFLSEFPYRLRVLSGHEQRIAIVD